MGSLLAPGTGEAITERKVYGFTFPTHWSVSLLVNGTVFGGMLLAVTMGRRFAPLGWGISPLKLSSRRFYCTLVS